MGNLYGLKKTEMDILQRILEKHTDIIEKAVIFGSRARGDFQPGSDIDVAVFTWKLEQDLLPLKEDVEQAHIIHTVDVIHYNKMTNEALRKEIE